MYSHIKHASLALCQQENMDAPSRSTWKTSRLFSHAEKHGHLYFAKIRWYNEIICVLPDNKPRTRDFFPLFCQSLLCYGGWRGCCALSFSLPASRLWLTAGPLSSLLFASPQPILMLIAEELARWILLFALQLSRDTCHFKWTTASG